MRAALGLAVLLAAAGPASAERPPPLPTRDVDVTYTTHAGGRVLTQRVRWSNVTRKLRVDPPTGGLFIVTDYQALRAFVVRAADHTVMEAPAPSPDSQGAFQRQGESQEAGLACTEWTTRDTNGKPTVVCITADGVLLRARAEGRTLVAATSVRFDPIDASVFDIPADYRHVSPPNAREGVSPPNAREGVSPPNTREGAPPSSARKETQDGSH